MESWPGQEKRVQTLQAAPLAKAMQRFELQAKRTRRERELTANQLAELRQLSEKPRPLEEPEHLALSPPLAWRWGRQALVSFAPVQPLSTPSPD